MTWNISYTPNSDRIRISSSKCFYLDIFNAGGEEIDPYEADVKTCRSSVGDIYNTTGRDSTSWFNWNGCASTKYYEVEAGGELTLRVHTASCPSCVCHHPDFNIYEEIDGNWVKYVIDRTCTDSDGGMAIYVKENVLVLVAHNMIFVLLIALVVLLLWSIHVMVVYVSAISMIVQMAV